MTITKATLQNILNITDRILLINSSPLNIRRILINELLTIRIITSIQAFLFIYDPPHPP